MPDIFNISEDDRLAAQYYAECAIYEEDTEESIRLCEKAVQIDPHCVDALALLACLVDNPTERAQKLRDIIQIAEDRLGGIQAIMEIPEKEFNLEVQSYISARAYLAQALYQSGDFKASAEEYEIILVIDSDDSCDVKNPLIGIYLDTLDLKGADRLLTEFGEDDTGTFCWATVLDRLLAGDPDGAMEALKHARDMLPLAEAYILGQRAMPRKIPICYEPGELDEAIYCADILGDVWRKYPEHFNWLKEHTQNGKSRTK